LLCQWLLGVNPIVHSHNIEGLRFQSMGKWWWKILWNYERFVHRHARFSFFITDEDRQYAFEKFGLPKSSSTTITYGIEQQSGPSAASKLAARNRLLEKHGLPPDCRLMLFNGTLSYQPNFDAVQSIVMQINPILAKEAPGPYCIFICGKELPVTKLQLPPQVVYTGFVDDIQTYYLGSDLFLNPVLDGGGIKTKLVESLSAHTMAVSYENGAIGVPKAIAGDALTIIQNQDYVSFAQAIVHLWNHKKETPAVYFEHFYWGNIARKAQQALNQV
ncbi:MAG TPA: glycosyltransferase family 4 protein, partial [Ferruginibacter sp.]|nr:glycosyltransferase family 4 protein [Ferruginibacter sp.]